jgi:hypothetical protein
MPVGRNRHNSYHKDTLQSPVSTSDSISQSWNNTTNLSSNENNINANNENNNNNSNNTRGKFCMIERRIFFTYSFVFKKKL